MEENLKELLVVPADNTSKLDLFTVECQLKKNSSRT